MRPTLQHALPMAALFALSACIGRIGDPSGGDTTGSSTEKDALGAPTPIRRLSRGEYEATLRALFGDAVIDAVASELAGLPDDRGSHEFSTMEQGITSEHVEGYYETAKAIAALVSRDAVRRGALAPCLAAPDADEACLAHVVADFGRRAFRRPLDAIEQSELLRAFHEGASQVSFEAGIALVLVGLLQAPPFLYRVELGAEPVAGHPDTFELTPLELATRLAYFLTGAGPDDELLDAAESGSLVDDASFRDEVERLANGEGARRQFGRFVTEWLALDRIPVPGQSADFLGGVDPHVAVEEMRQEATRILEHHVFEAGSDFASLMQTPLVLPGTNLAAIYGTAAAADPLTPVAIDDPHRQGVLTRAAFLSTVSAETHPVRRGAFIIRKLLCDDIAPPPPSKNLQIAPPPYDPNKTARERWTMKTSQPQCVGCHGRINPFGFALEHYDPIGRYRDLEPILDPQTGEVVAKLPIDAKVDVELDGAEVEVDGGADLSAALAASPTARACVGKKWFRYLQGRRETSEDDAQLGAIVDRLAKPGGAVRDALVEIVMSPAFRTRRLP